MPAALYTELNDALLLQLGWGGADAVPTYSLQAGHMEINPLAWLECNRARSCLHWTVHAHRAASVHG